MKKAILSLFAIVTVAGVSAEACNVVPQGTCYVKETGRYISSNQFFSTLSEISQSEGRCIVGRVHGKQSGRMYYSGRRLAKHDGCLSHKELSEWKSFFGLTGECQTLTCQEL